MSKPPADLGVGHCDRRAKSQLRDERPRYTVSRDTHHRLLSGFAQALSRGGGIVQSATEGQTVRLSPALFQPMASDDVAAAMADFAVGAPVNGTVEVAGPQRVRLTELVQQFLKAGNDPRQVIADPQARYFGAALNDETLVPGDKARLGSTSYDDWLSASKGTLVYLLALGVFMAGVGRLVSISQVGLPEPAALWLGYMIPELVLPFVIALTHRAALRR